MESRTPIVYTEAAASVQRDIGAGPFERFSEKPERRARKITKSKLNQIKSNPVETPERAERGEKSATRPQTSKRKKRRRRRSKSRSRNSVRQTEEKMEELTLKDTEDIDAGPSELMTVTEGPRFYVPEERSGLLEDGRCRDCLMDCGKTRSGSEKHPIDFRFLLVLYRFLL